MFNVSVQDGRGYLLVVSSGNGRVHPLCASARFIDELVQRTGARRVLLDMMALTPMLNEEERKEVSMVLYETIHRLERLAILMPQAVSLGLLLQAARAKGVDAKEFDDIAAAERWLKSDTAA